MEDSLLGEPTETCKSGGGRGGGGGVSEGVVRSVRCVYQVCRGDEGVFAVEVLKHEEVARAIELFLPESQVSFAEPDKDRAEKIDKKQKVKPNENQVVIHVGSGMNHGHYVALSKIHDQW